MKLGINSSILGHYNFEEMMAFASKLGYECVEVACWPVGKAERRYAGVTHIDVNTLNDAAVQSIHNTCEKYNLKISALAYYPNALDPDLNARNKSITHFKKVIEGAALLGVDMVTGFIGRDRNLTLDANLELMMQIWPDIVGFAEDRHIKIAIENCPMWFSNDEWPGGNNLFTTPAIWRRVFDLIPNENFGINYDPSHFIWQHINYIKPLYEFKDRIFHVHFKDIKLYQDKLDDHGVMANPLEYMAPKLPGLGDVDWGLYVSALNDIGFTGDACIEVEDKSFEDSTEAIDKSVELSYRYLRQFII